MGSWLEKFAKSVADVAGESDKKDIIKGHGKLGARPTPSQRAKWIKGVMERLDALVDKEARRRIMINRAALRHKKKFLSLSVIAQFRGINNCGKAFWKKLLRSR